MYYKYHRVNFRLGRSNTDCPDWTKKKKGIINLENKDEKCFHQVVIDALNYEEINWNSEKFSKISDHL